MKTNTKKTTIRIALTALTLIVALLTSLAMGAKDSKQDPLQTSIAGKVLRFHVLANSDSDADQTLKKQVRDAIGGYLEPKLSGAGSIEETRDIVKGELDQIAALAQDEVRTRGYDYAVSAELAHTDFPVKSYGAYTFPAGEYEALEVTIGEGKGHNWWCVLYPNMCFRGSVYEEVSEDAESELREVLSPEEYADVFQSGRFHVRWKFLEWFS